ncbi:MAG: MBL fold metallo-hydrolase [Acidimicrobiales bacterium]
MGSGTLGCLQLHLKLPELAGVVVTSSSVGHWGELPTFFHACSVAFRFPGGLPIYMPEGYRNWFEYEPPSGSGVELIEMDKRLVASEWSVGELRIAGEGDGQSMALAVGGSGVKIMYSSDMGAGWSPRADWRGVDLAMIEATLGSEGKSEQTDDRRRHMTAEDAGRLATELEAKRLLVTHVSPKSYSETLRDCAAEWFSGPVDLASRNSAYHIE